MTTGVTILIAAQVFVRVYTSAQEVKDSPSKLAYVFQSQGCDSFYFQRVGRKVRLFKDSSPPCSRASVADWLPPSSCWQR